MKALKTILVLLPFFLCQCASYKLVRVDGYNNGKLADRDTYKYKNGELSSIVHVSYPSEAGGLKSYRTTDYIVRNTDSGVDSIELSYTASSDTSVIVKSYNLQGVLLSRKTYSWAWDGRKETSQVLYDSDGYITEWHVYGDYHQWFFRDRESGSYVIREERVTGKINNRVSLKIDSIMYSFDGQHTVRIRRVWNDGDSLTAEYKTVYESDRNSRVVLDSAANWVCTYDYELDRRGRVKVDTQYAVYHDGSSYDRKTRAEYRYDLMGRKKSIRSYELSADKPYLTKTRYAYRRGKKVKEIKWLYEDGEKTLVDCNKCRYNLFGQLVETQRKSRNWSSRQKQIYRFVRE